MNNIMFKQGFSLIEVLITIAIFAIISTIAYPSYINYVQSARKTDALSVLYQQAQAMERHYSVGFTYEGAASGGANTGVPSSGIRKSPQEGNDTYYTIQISAATATSFLLQASAAGSQVDSDCPVLTLSHSMVGSPADCW